MPMNAHPRLLVEERRQKILDHVDKQGRVTVDEMVKKFGVSAVTVADHRAVLSPGICTEMVTITCSAEGASSPSP